MKKNNENIIEMTILSTTENLSVVRNLIQNSTMRKNIPERIINEIMLAVDEACTNVIKHAYKSDPHQEIKVSIEFLNDEIIITFIDHGISFNPDEIPSPDLQQYMQQRKVGGLGLHLMRTLMDKVDYKSIKGKYNRLILSKKIGNSTAA